MVSFESVKSLVLDQLDELGRIATNLKNRGDGFPVGSEDARDAVKEAVKELRAKVIWDARRDDEWSFVFTKDMRVIAVADVFGPYCIDVTDKLRIGKTASARIKWTKKGRYYVGETRLSFEGTFRSVENEKVQYRVDATDIDIRADWAGSLSPTWESIDDSTPFATVEEAKEWCQLHATECVKQRTFTPRMPRRY